MTGDAGGSPRDGRHPTHPPPNGLQLRTAIRSFVRETFLRRVEPSPRYRASVWRIESDLGSYRHGKKKSCETSRFVSGNRDRAYCKAWQAVFGDLQYGRRDRGRPHHPRDSRPQRTGAGDPRKHSRARGSPRAMPHSHCTDSPGTKQIAPDSTPAPAQRPAGTPRYSLEYLPRAATFTLWCILTHTLL
jgi:hypothetical protein